MSEQSSAVPEHGVVPAAEDEVVDICRDLIRIDTSNYGDGSGPGERKAAEHVAALLEEVGLTTEIVESAPGRASVVTRITGADPTRPALVVHGHTDVVPARAEDWRVDPFAAEVEDGCVWGRGAVDMKDMDAMILASVRELVRSGRRPPRDLVVAFFADEEAGGTYGARYLVDHRPDLFEGATEAVSEVGGFSTTIAGRRAYLLQTAEKGLLWLRLVAHGRAGHGSQVNTDNAVTRLCEAVARIGAHPWPLDITPTVRSFLDGVEEITGTPLPADDPDALVAVLGSTAAFVGATLRNTSNPTLLEAGYKHNVIPGSASALVDCRFIPGREEQLLATVRELAGSGVDVETVHRAVSLDTPFSGALVDAMVGALEAEDPGCAVLPYCLSGGTDNKSLSDLGITGYGFAPLRLPPELDFAGMFHGVDERVPLDALRFGVRVLRRFLETA
ncbi:M20/M25/M40 family metallo-hydrolase [Kineosporia sp. A_224]|uniref:M20/M25/M40 family metallo-hydrolase n=1 Tax=Kineosporia sp. A_224 TaxID=1962180 RepID=UPI000B4AF731|nr:M20/M25/M40 family metallo-hydrolase [Kineosporia sp. A_224]